MRLKRTIGVMMATAVVAGATFVPTAAGAQNRYHDYDRDYQYRQQSSQRNSYYRQNRHRRDLQNQWRDIAVGAGLLGALGLIERDRTLFFAGTAGALYSVYRYEQDRNSSRDVDRLRAEYFSRSYFHRNGVRYNRETVVRNGRRYYRFVRE